MNLPSCFWLILLLLVAGPAQVVAVPDAPSDGKANAKAAASAPDASYTLKPDDVLELSVFGEDDLSTTTKILKTGEAVFPLIGAVNVGGLNLDAATTRIRGLYADKYLVNPRVTITVSSYGEQWITVLGAVKTAGTFPVPASGSIDLASAVALAGGLSEDADSRSISVIRSSGATSVHSKGQLTGQGSAVQLRAGDRVVVGQSAYVGKSVTILGRVMRPGPIPFPLDGNLDIIRAISQAGGFHELANPKKVNVSREGKVQVIDVRELSERGGSAFRLQPGDVLTVPERIF